MTTNMMDIENPVMKKQTRTPTNEIKNRTNQKKKNDKSISQPDATYSLKKEMHLIKRSNSWRDKILSQINKTV